MAGIVEDGNLKELLFACCLLILITFYILYVEKKKEKNRPESDYP